jgi:hypothetical protein
MIWNYMRVDFYYRVRLREVRSVACCFDIPLEKLGLYLYWSRHEGMMGY